ncbi:MAG: glycosyltransferase family 4 protein [Ignavibacteria bacterium]|nr:glycosyltransferase family 4 protein [Ignavibacteria bacterium]
MWGGGEYYTLRLACELKRNNHYVAVTCFENSDLMKKALENSLEVIPLPENLTNIISQITAVRTISDYVKKLGINIVHTNTSKDRTIGAIAAKLSGALHITSCHSLESLRHNLTHIIRNSYMTDAFIADGFSMKDLLIKSDRIPEEKIYVIHNGINPDDFKREADIRYSSRKCLGINENDIVIGNVARFVPFKGHKYLLEAFHKLKIKYENVKLLLVGSGELEAELIDSANKLKIADKVIFAGHIEDLNSFYNATDIYVQPSLNEGGELFPYTVLYAMAHAIPVIVTDSGDMSYMVENGVNGYVVKNKSSDEISDKLRILVSDTVKRSSMGKASYRRLTENFTFEIMYSNTLSLYNSLLQKEQLTN